jgi:signal transduction histidine kinase
MTIRSRMTLWYGGVLLFSGLAIAGLARNELHERPENPGEAGEGWQEVVGLVCWIGLPAAGLSVAGGWLLMRRALAPVAALTRAAERVSERNLTEKLPRSGNGDELDRLTEVLNAMTARLHDSFSRIREFTLHASHELKTPLTVLCAETESELADTSLSPARRARATSSLEELQRLGRIVDGLTLLAKADAGHIKLTLAPVRLDELMRDSFADVQVLAQASGLNVELVACQEAWTHGDAHRLRQLLLNLADNAVKYNCPGGAITLALRRVGLEAQFTISNTGPGIPAELLPRVFEPFFRGDSAHSHEVEGCGLGLSIAQWIVSVHKGSIRIDSMPAKLTTVTVGLPLSRESGTQ